MSHELSEEADYYSFLVDFLSHEIRNPLSAVIMFSNLLREGAYGDLNGEQQDVLERILANSTRIEHMVDDFTNLSFVNGSRSFFRKEELDLYGDLIEPAIGSLEKKLLFSGDRGRTFHREVEESVPVFADRALMLIVFDNILFNAIKYGRKDGEVVYGWRKEGAETVVTVSNQGMGVPPEDLETIFEKFTRLRDPGMEPQRGTGLGLYNVRKILQMHGGRAWAEAEYGSWFKILLALPEPGEQR